LHVETLETCGVAQARVTVTYRFEKANELKRVVPPQAYLPAPIRIPVKPKTVGDHLRLRRLKLKLLQKEVAERLGCDKGTIYFWEANGAQPRLEYMPAIIQFLGYNPLPPANSWAQRLVRGRIVLGISQQVLARKLGVDPATLALWERGEREPATSTMARVDELLREPGPRPKTDSSPDCTASSVASV